MLLERKKHLISALRKYELGSVSRKRTTKCFFTYDNIVQYKELDNFTISRNSINHGRNVCAVLCYV